jgi:hypothetical protein
MTDAVLGIDVSKTTLDTSFLAGTKPRSRSFANSPDGWHQLIAWLAKEGVRQACLEATGRHSLGIALALHEAGHVVMLWCTEVYEGRGVPWFLDHQAARTDPGRPRSSIRLRTLTAILVSTSCAGRL